MTSTRLDYLVKLAAEKKGSSCSISKNNFDYGRKSLLSPRFGETNKPSRKNKERFVPWKHNVGVLRKKASHFPPKTRNRN